MILFVFKIGHRK